MIRTWNDTNLSIAVANSRSVAEVLKFLGLKPTGGNYDSMRRHIDRLQLDCSHFAGQAWSRNQVFVTEYTSKAVRNRLKKEIGGCETCGLTQWNGDPIPLEIDHIDGNNSNNDRSNLRVLCPNCHAQTPTYRNSKR